MSEQLGVNDLRQLLSERAEAGGAEYAPRIGCPSDGNRAERAVRNARRWQRRRVAVCAVAVVAVAAMGVASGSGAFEKLRTEPFPAAPVRHEQAGLPRFVDRDGPMRLIATASGRPADGPVTLTWTQQTDNPIAIVLWCGVDGRTQPFDGMIENGGDGTEFSASTEVGDGAESAIDQGWAWCGPGTGPAELWPSTLRVIGAEHDRDPRQWVGRERAATVEVRAPMTGQISTDPRVSVSAAVYDLGPGVTFTDPVDGAVMATLAREYLADGVTYRIGEPAWGRAGSGRLARMQAPRDSPFIAVFGVGHPADGAQGAIVHPGGIEPMSGADFGFGALVSNVNQPGSATELFLTPDETVPAKRVGSTFVLVYTSAG